jgi:hypothetical protein
MMILFACNNPDCHNKIEKMFRTHKDIPPFLDCGACSVGKLERQLGAPTTKTTQFVNNGGLTKDIEIMNEVVNKESERFSKGD